MLKHVLDLSRLLHDLIYRPDVSESLCSRAWRLREAHTFWAVWVSVFGQNHCRKSHRHYWG